MRYEKYYVGITENHKGLFYQLRGKETAPNRVPDGNINMINETSFNNGVTKKASSNYIFKAPAITVSVNYAQTVFMQEEDFCASVNILILKNDWLDNMPMAGLYVVSALVKNNQKYDYSCKISKDRLNDTIIILPTLDELDAESPYSSEGFVPDFNYMQERIEELEQERIEELEQYLAATGLNDYTLTDEDREVLSLSGFRDNKESDSKDVVKVCKEFKVIDISNVGYGNKFDKNKMTSMNPTINFVSRTATNNGISDFVDNNGTTPYPAGLITLALGGSIGSCFLQEAPFYTGQNVGVIDLGDIDIHAKIYFTEALGNKCKKSFNAFGNEINKHLKTDLSVLLPIQTDIDGNPVIDSDCKYHPDGCIPDWEFMEKYIRAIEKIVVADVVKYKDEMITKSKKLIG